MITHDCPRNYNDLGTFSSLVCFKNERSLRVKCPDVIKLPEFLRSTENPILQSLIIADVFGNIECTLYFYLVLRYLIKRNKNKLNESKNKQKKKHVRLVHVKRKRLRNSL